MNRNRVSSLITVTAVVVVLWAALVIALYFVVHKPWGAALNLAPFMAVADVMLAVGLVCLAGGAGRRIARPMGEELSPERAAIEAALGLGVIGIGVLVVGMAGLLSQWAAWLGLLGGLVLLRKDALVWLREWKALFDPETGANGLGRWVRWFVFLLVGLNLLKALAPPLKWDSLAYHLTLPQRYLAAGRIFFFAENLYGGFPQLAEMWFTWAAALRALTTAAVLGWAVGVIALAGVEGFSRSLLGARAAWLAPAILLSGYSISQTMNWAYVDLWVLLFGLVMFIALERYLRQGGRGWLVVAGGMVGFAVGTKYTAGMLGLFGAMLLLPVWESIYDRLPNRAPDQDGRPAEGVASRRGWKKFIVDLLIFGGIAVLVTLPWLAKNLILAGNPLYPLVSFDDRLDPWRQTFQSGPSPKRSLLSDALLPFEVTIYGIESAAVQGKPEYGMSVGPLMLALIPGLLVGWKGFERLQQLTLLRLLALVGCAWLLWSLLAHFADELSRPRHYFGVFGALAVLATGGFLALAGIQLGKVRLGRLLAALLALALALAALAEVTAFAASDPLPVLLGGQEQTEYVSQELGWHGEAMQAINALPSEAQVLFLWEPRTLYCQRACLLDATLDNWWYLRRTAGDAQAIAAALRERGVTHVLVYDSGVRMLQDSTAKPEYEAADWTELKNLVGSELIKISDFGGQYSLYALRGAANEP